MNFWQNLPNAFTVGAPMDDVTDVAFRTVIARRGKPDVMYTEFTSADGLVRAPELGKTKLLRKLAFAPIERPVVAQLFSAVPSRMEAAAQIVAKLGFDGLDINTGCPDKTVEKQGCGSALIKNPQLFKELYAAAVQGVSEMTSVASSSRKSPRVGFNLTKGNLTNASTRLFSRGLATEVVTANTQKIPVSVKCRIGYYKPEIDTWLRTILEQKPDAMVVHLRTREEMSKVPAHWELMPEIVALRNDVSPSTVLVGNGDIHNVEHGKRMVAETGCDGVMIGRGMFGNPWYGTMHIATREERIAALIEHIEEFDRQLAGIKSFAVMKKHFAAYMSHFDGAHDIRLRLMDTNTADEALAVLHSTI